jgi:hypothetical protein
MPGIVLNQGWSAVNAATKLHLFGHFSLCNGKPILTLFRLTTSLQSGHAHCK